MSPNCATRPQWVKALTTCLPFWRWHNPMHIVERIVLCYVADFTGQICTLVSWIFIGSNNGFAQSHVISFMMKLINLSVHVQVKVGTGTCRYLECINVFTAFTTNNSLTMGNESYIYSISTSISHTSPRVIFRCSCNWKKGHFAEVNIRLFPISFDIV